MQQTSPSQAFLKKAIQGNFAEVEMGKLAQRNGQDDSLKKFGQTLIEDHSAANQKAIDVAKSMGVTPPEEPNAKQKADYDKRAKMSGAQFDRDFATHMVAYHEKDIAGIQERGKADRSSRRVCQRPDRCAAKASPDRKVTEVEQDVQSLKPSAWYKGGHAAVDWAEAVRGADLERAWEISDRSLQEYCRSGVAKHAGERHFQRIWRGEPLEDRRVLVRCYHGLGDTIQFVRFAEPLRRIARKVLLWVQPELIELLRGVDGIDGLLPLHDGTPDVDYDVDIEVMELAHALRVTSAFVSGRVPYLRVPRSSNDQSALQAPDSPVSVGLVWEAGNWDRRRCLPPSALARLHTIPGIRLYSLQQGPGREAANAIPAEDIATSELPSLAATIMRLDVILTIDTMVAHLAGALGARVWTMLHADCDWRWPKTGSRSIWYPTMKLFHQPSSGDWDGLLEEVATELTRFAPAARY
jgi:predicted outer membrane protein